MEAVDEKSKKSNKPETRLRMMIRKRGVTQKKLADMANLEVYQISQLASGIRKDCLLSTAKKICAVLKCTIDQAFGSDELDRKSGKRKTSKRSKS